MPRPRLPHGEPAPSPEDASVTVTVARKVAPGREADFEEWVQGIVEAAAKFPGFLGAGALRPPEAGREWHVVYRFADADKQRAWETSAERAAWLARADEFACETGATHVSGLETWFALPGRTAPAPPKWKMAVVTFAAIYPLALLANVVLVPRTAAWPLLFRPIAFAGVLVPLMTWIVMPRLTRLLRRWLALPSIVGVYWILPPGKGVHHWPGHRGVSCLILMNVLRLCRTSRLRSSS